MRLDGRVAVVTGGASGIGEAVAIRFREEGARVAVLDLNLEAAKLTADVAGGGHAIATDVSDSAAVDAALAEVEERLGPVDVWVNNAGISGRAHAERVQPRAEQQMNEMATGTVTTALDALIQVTDEEFQQMLAVHLGGTFYGTRAAARSMVARGTGSIVNVASICGIEGCEGHPHYSAAKAGILGLTRSVGKELIQQGVRVNAVAPGFVVTPMMTADTSETLLAAIALGTPIRRLGGPKEIAAAVAFLASDDASYCVGETISPNGGFTTVYDVHPRPLTANPDGIRRAVSGRARVSTARSASSPSAASRVTPKRSISRCASAAIACHSDESAARSKAARSSKYTSATRNMPDARAFSPPVRTVMRRAPGSFSASG